MNSLIVTVGICPVWDITNYVDGIDWGQHKVVSSQTIVPAGKPLNVSKTLAKMSVKSTAAGLWGKSDYQQLVEGLSTVSDFINLKMTVVEGKTRQNITIVDTKGNREIHLRAQSALATVDNLERLKSDLDEIVDSGATVVFAGSMPEGPLLDNCLEIMKDIIEKGANLIIDTSETALTRIAELRRISMIKPNLEELSQLLGQTFGDDKISIVNAARTLCSKIDTILVSMGDKGALVITKDRAIHCYAKPSGYKVINTVSCGDYLLAGFICEPELDICPRLQTAVKLACAKAWGLTEKMDCKEIIKQVGVEVQNL
ncbi:MAG: PfkB family carbohydrate kinase [Phycisphaerales bacterium]